MIPENYMVIFKESLETLMNDTKAKLVLLLNKYGQQYLALGEEDTDPLYRWLRSKDATPSVLDCYNQLVKDKGCMATYDDEKLYFSYSGGRALILTLLGPDSSAESVPQSAQVANDKLAGLLDALDDDFPSFTEEDFDVLFSS